MPQRDVVETEAGAGEPLLGPPAVGPPQPVATAAAATAAGFRWQSLGRWEVALVGFVIATVLFGAAESHYFLSGGDFFDFGLNIGPIALMALPLTFIVMTGEIDLSVASTLGLACSLLGYLFEHGWPLPLAIVTVLVMGVVTGTFNGILVTRLGLPSLAVTIGTLTLYRGIAEIILGSSSVTGFPNSYDKVGTSPIPGTEFTWTLGIFVVLAVVFGVVLHATPLGRSLYAIGLNKDTAFFSGIRVKRIKLLLYTLSGVICAGAGHLVDVPVRQFPLRRRDGFGAGRGDRRALRRHFDIRGQRHHHRCDHGRLRDRRDTERPDPDQRLSAGAGGGHRVLADHQRRPAQLGGDTGRVASQMGTGCPQEVMNVLGRLMAGQVLEARPMAYASHGPMRQGNSGERQCSRSNR